MTPEAPAPGIPPGPTGHIGTTEIILAKQCAAGDLAAGVKLVNALRGKGAEPSMERMITLAGGVVSLTVVDRFADARALADRARALQLAGDLDAFRAELAAAGLEDHDDADES